MTVRKYSSRAQQTTLSSAITDTATSMTVVSGSALMGGKTLTGSQTYTVVIDPDTSLEEIVDVTLYSSGNTLTITRNRDGSSAVAHSAGAVVRHMVIGRDLQEANDHIEASSAVHGLTGTVVGTTDTQTLSAKTLTTPTVNGATLTGTVTSTATITGGTVNPTTLQQGGVQAVTTTGSQTLTNKILTTPTIDGATITGTVTASSATFTSPTISGSPVITGLSSAGMTTSSAVPKSYVDTLFGDTAAAATSAASAATSASSAATSATSSATSASAAATSATNAANSATAAATSATSSATSASASASSASAAATSESNASASASAASTSASSAATSASSAATSATSAATSASSAETSATSAAASATAAAASAASVDATATLAVEFRNYAAEGSVLNNLPARVHPGETLLKQAAYWIDSAHSSAAGQTITNLGYAGSVLPTTLGSTTSADSNDPKFLDWDGTNYVYLSGTSSNALIVPDSAALDITGDLDLRVQLAMDDWTPAGTSILISKRNGASTEYSYTFYVTSSGTLGLSWSADGATEVRAAVSSVATGITDGTTKWVRATLDVDNGSSANDVNFYLSDDGVTWTQLGTTRNAAGTTSIYSGTADVRIGVQYNSIASGNTAGKFYRAQICNGIDSVPVLDVDTSVITSGAATSFTALTGQTVTINRSTSGRKTVCVVHPVWLFGTDDYMEVNNRYMASGTYLYLPGVSGNYASTPDAAALDITGDIDLRVKVAMDDWTPSASNYLMAKNATSSSLSYGLYLDTSGKLVLVWSTNGTTVSSALSTVATGITDGATKWVRATLDVDNGASGNDVAFYTSDDGTTWTQLGTTVTTAGTTSIFNSTSVLEIGSRFVGTNGLSRGKFFRAQVRNGIGGTVAFDANFETSITSLEQASFTESSANSATVTINRSGSAYRSAGITRAGYLIPGGTNTFQASGTSLLDFGASDEFTLLLAFRPWSTISSGSVLLAHGRNSNATTTTGKRYVVRYGATNTAYIILDDGTNVDQTESVVTLTSGTLSTLAEVVTTTTLQGVLNGTASASSTRNAGDLNAGSNAVHSLVIGGLGAVGSDLELMAVAVFRRALTSAEITTIYNYYSGRVGA
jgi:hypothetical protein